MKKLVSLFVVVLLCFCSFAMAEDVDLSVANPDFTSKIITKPDTEFRQPSFGTASTDIVSRSGNTYIVIAPECVYSLDISCFPSAICLTQDMNASFEGYLCCTSPADQLESLIANEIHYEVYDFETDLKILIYCLGSDPRTTMIGDYNTLSEENRVIYAQANGLSECKQLGDRWWACGLEDKYGKCFTIMNGYFIEAICCGNAPEEDLADMETLLSNLVLR